MFDFLKTCGQGLLYLILSPLLLIIVVGYAVYSLFVFFFMLGKRVIMFFSGDDMKEEMKIDKLAKMHIKQLDQEEEVKNSIQVQSQSVIEKNNTTVVQPIIIQTDEKGVLKSVQMGPNPIQNQVSHSIDNTIEISEPENLKDSNDGKIEDEENE